MACCKANIWLWIEGTDGDHEAGLQDAWFPVRNLKPELPDYKILYQNCAYQLTFIRQRH